MIASRFFAAAAAPLRARWLSTLMRGLFDPSKYRTFRFTERSLSPDGTIRLTAGTTGATASATGPATQEATR